MENKRNYGLDSLRVIAIILITSIHFIGYSNVLKNSDILSANYGFLTLFSSLSITGVNVFVLITGFFQCDKKAQKKKFFNLWLQVTLLSILLTVFAFVCFGHVTIIGILKTIFPLSTVHFWFFVTYVMLYAISPVLNYIIANWNKRSHWLFCIIGAFVICVLYVMNPFADENVYLGHYHGICWFAFLYIVGAYIKKYDFPIKKKYTVLIGIVVLALTYIINYFNLALLKQYLVEGNYSLFSFLLSVIIFDLFKDVEIKNKFFIGALEQLSACSFFVYIIQEHNLIRKWYWGLFDIGGYADSYFLIAVFILSLLALWPFAYVYNKMYDLLVKNYTVLLYSKIESLITRIMRNGS